MKKFLFILIFVLCTNVFTQQLSKYSIQVGETKSEINGLVRSGLTYLSAKELSQVLGGSATYNFESNKLVISNNSSQLIFSARNQFIVLVNKDSSKSNLQIPVSTLIVKDEIFIPAIYALDLFKTVFSKEILFIPDTKSLIVKELAPAEEEAKQTASKKFDISEITIEEKTNGTLVTLKANKIIRVPRSSINNGTLYVFLTNTTIAPGIITKAKPAGLISKLKQNYISPKNLQLEFSLKEGYSTSETFFDAETNSLLITIHNKLFIQDEEAAKAKWNFDCIVIDAGHGGKDPGTIGVTGKQEKDINLSIALKLGRLIEDSLSSIRVVYTRKKDEFIELYKRGKIANEAGGKLFISIHCNSTVKKDNNYRGFEVYLLRPGRTQDAIEIAEVENSVIKYEENQNRYEKLTEENFILVSMAHSQYMRYSENFSDILNQTWKKEVSIPSLGIKQAGFYVLVGASMPSVLVEAGFLSNRKDELFLSSEAGQAEVALAIFNSIKQYKEKYEKEMGK